MRERFTLSSFPTPRLPSRQTFLLLLYTLALFFGFLFLTFPHDLCLKWLEGSLSQNLPVHLTYTRGRFAWWQGYELRGVAFRLAPWAKPALSKAEGPGLSKAEGPDSDLPLLSLSRLFVRPRLRQLILGQPFPLRVYGELYGGNLEGEFLWQEPLVHGSLVLRRLDLSRYRFPFPLTEVSVDGIMNLEASFAGQASDLYTHRGEVTAILQGGGIAGGKVRGFSLPQLHFSRIRLHGRLEKGRMEVQELIAQFDELEVQGEGQVHLRTPLSQSLVDLRFSLKAMDSPPPALRTLLALLPPSSDSQENRTLVISGTVGYLLLR